ncbi:sodium-dependent glucose transporter 1A-like protein [Dinothrombium tinctorium]|uniref:Sodium-dependent glucose transporter 1A-like protein n=1 Tax=Dinothrombium tinctorium TaxID=1965070 RepID=A0A443RQE1_9ACAR|nr:sodium-dependent glucose transporter 1A-like protein [Dinothrombium tinctorium]
MSTLNEIKLHKCRFLKSCALFISFVFLGLNVALPGATLLDLEIAVNCSTEQITRAVPIKSSGYLVGAFVNSFLVKIFDSQICIIGSLIASTIISGLIPWNRTLIGLYVCMFFAGFPSGILDASGNIWLLHLWGKEIPPFIQILHFMYGCGAFVAPLIAERFLLPLQSKIDFNKYTNLTMKTESSKYTPNDLKIQYAYAIISMYGLFAFITFIVVYMFKRSTKPHPTRQKAEDENEIAKRMSGSTNYCILFFASIMLLLYLGLELMFGTLLPTYSVKCNLKFDKSKASFITSVFWLTFAFFGKIIFFIIQKLGSQNVIIVDLLLILASNAFLLPFGDSLEWCLWTGVVLVGLGTSSLFGAVFGFLESFTKITTKMASVIFISVCTGELIIPFIVGHYADTKPAVFLYITLICSVLCCFCFIILIIMKYKCIKSIEKDQTEDESVKF